MVILKSVTALSDPFIGLHVVSFRPFSHMDAVNAGRKTAGLRMVANSCLDKALERPERKRGQWEGQFIWMPSRCASQSILRQPDANWIMRLVSAMWNSHGASASMWPVTIALLHPLGNVSSWEGCSLRLRYLSSVPQTVYLDLSLVESITIPPPIAEEMRTVL
jgi:hypothetical protein